MNLDVNKLDVAVALHAELRKFLREHPQALLVEARMRAFPVWAPMSRFAAYDARGEVLGVCDRRSTPEDVYHMVFA